jgi:hypothetical protein
MKKKNSEPDYSDQYDSFPLDSCETDELRAWTIYEYARESKTLLCLAEKHKRILVGNELGDALGEIRWFSVPFSQIVAAIGHSSSLDKSWRELSLEVQKKLIASCKIPPVRFASRTQALMWLEPDTCPPFGEDFTGTVPFGEEQTIRLVSLFIDASLTKSDLLSELEVFFKKNIPSSGWRGRSAKSETKFSNALRYLAALRAFSTRKSEDAIEILAKIDPRIQSSLTIRSLRLKCDEAKRFFLQLFPKLSLDSEFSLRNEMISYDIYKQHHKVGG